MADNQKLKEEEKEAEEIVGQNGESDRSCVEARSKDQSSQLETLVEELDVKPAVIDSFVPPEFKIEPFGMSHQEVLTCVTAQAQAQMPVQAEPLYSSLELLHVPIRQSLSSTISPSPLRQRSPKLHQDNTPEVNQESSSDQNREAAHIIVKSPSPDGYNWRKYGQKSVKSSDSSRSYYRCTHISCLAKKKVARCDHSGHVVEIIYKGEHNHDPPQNVRVTKAKSLSASEVVSSPETGEGSGTIDCLSRKLNTTHQSTSSKKPRNAIPEQKVQGSKDCTSDAVVKSEERCDQISAKQRMKGRNVAYADSLCKVVKEPKIVVQASDDVGISGDGYRWRKYGQKMVKGKANPRSYYRCTSAGCPVRKHVERATDETTTIMITYEGRHDHDMPVPRKHQGPPSATLIAAATATNNEPKKSNALENSESSTQFLMDVEREVADDKASEFGGEKALESARTLLSIGIELRPC